MGNPSRRKRGFEDFGNCREGRRTKSALQPVEVGFRLHCEMSGRPPASSQLQAPSAVPATKKARPAEEEFDLAILASSECIKMQGSPRRAPVVLPPVVFSDLEQYRSTFQALILEECKAILAAAWQDANQGKTQDKMHMGCSVKVFFPMAGEDFCYLEVHKPSKSRLSLDPGQLVFVQEGGSRKGIAIVNAPISNNAYLLRTFAGTDLVNGNYDMLVVDNLTTSRRAFISVSGLADFSPSLRQQILNPLLNSEFVSWLKNAKECEAALASQQPWLSLSSTSFNRHQRLALLAVLRLKRGIFLIQGPPGTGKTATITGMVAALLYENSQTKILVCAPSNAAADEVSLRSLAAIHEREGKASAPERGWIVRLGPRSSISNACHPITLDGLLSGEKFFGSREAAEKDLVRNASVVCTTLSSCGHWYLDELNLLFDIVIIDEAVQATESEVLIALRRAKNRCVMIGDPCQLPATVFQFPAFAFRRSLFERMQEAGAAVHLLAIQYRMHKLISHFPSHHFYNGALRDAREVESRGWILDRRKFVFSRFEFSLHHYTFLDLPWGTDEADESRSRFNNDEAEAVVAVVRAILLSRKERIEMGVVTPYTSQRTRIYRTLTDREKRYCEINTIDGFQGREKDAIVVSCVRAQQDKGLGFVSDERRINVALTRAKSLLVVIGHAQTLERASPVWRALIEDARARGLYQVLRKQQLRSGSSSTGHSRHGVSGTRRDPESERSRLQEESCYEGAEFRRNSLTALAFSDAGRRQTKFDSREAGDEGSRRSETHRLELLEVEAGTSKGRNLEHMIPLASQVQEQSEAENNKFKPKEVKLGKTLSSELQNEGGIQKIRHTRVSAGESDDHSRAPPRTVELDDAAERGFPRLHVRGDNSKQEKGLTSENQSEISKVKNVESEMPTPDLSVQSKASDLQRKQVRASGTELHNQNEHLSGLFEQSEAKHKKQKRDGAREVGSVKDGALDSESDDHSRAPSQEPRTVEASASELHGAVERAFPRPHVRGANCKQEKGLVPTSEKTRKSAPDLAEQNEANLLEHKQGKTLSSELQNQGGIRQDGASAYESDGHSRAQSREPRTVEPSFSKLHDAGERASPTSKSHNVESEIASELSGLVPTSEKDSETSKGKNVESETPAPGLAEHSLLEQKQDRHDQNEHALGLLEQNEAKHKKRKRDGAGSLGLRELGGVKNRKGQHDVQEESESCKAAHTICKSLPTSQGGCHQTKSAAPSEAGEGIPDQKEGRSCKSKTGETGSETEAGNCKRKKVKHGKASSSGLQNQSGAQKTRRDGPSAREPQIVEPSAAEAGKCNRKQEKGESGSRKNKIVEGAPALLEQSEDKDLKHKKLQKHGRALGVELHDQTEAGIPRRDLPEQNDAANSKHKKLVRDRVSTLGLQNQRESGGEKNRNVEQSAAGDRKIVQHDGSSAPQLQQGDHAATNNQARAQIGADNRWLPAEPEPSEATLKRKARRIRQKLRKLLEAKKTILEQLLR